ncbi:c-type cytochrome [Mesorhizobium sp. M9A.F.Ca.ET.002.03.1.2]|uniref:c-type cytochrome n=1 Tax=Mesorhizobium sp. M9A.F.Ca.ET.002.03.1.2 TaxID=2493668 RepID=UPI001FE0627B|nr:c-type cytochrome [Mesorhizobium sp. M9A.F.Ca.ET.002.03.1.2]
MRRTAVLLSTLGMAAAGLGLAWPWLADWMGGASTAATALGKTVYAERCATCHGVSLEGQRDWKRPMPSGRMPAPPHDVSGHTWHHPDGVLFRITKEGPAAVVGGGYQSDMPGFGKVLTDEEIRAVPRLHQEYMARAGTHLSGEDEPPGEDTVRPVQIRATNPSPTGKHRP